MNKRAEAVNKSLQWKETREGNYIVRRDNWGNVTARTPLPKTQSQPSRVNSVPQKPQPQARPQARPQVSKVKPSPQSQKDFNYGRPPAGLSNEAWTIYNLGKSERQELRRDSDAEWRRADEAARNSQRINNAATLQLQREINRSGERNTKTTTDGNVKGEFIKKDTAKVIGKSNENVATIQGKSAGEVARTQADASKFGATESANASKFAATESANASRDVANTQASSSNYQSDNQFKGLKYQTDKTAETEDKRIDSNFFIEREKNANQKEKNKQDLWLNAGLGLLDSMNKQTASSSQAAAQIYSSYLSNNPYNFKYWN